MPLTLLKRAWSVTGFTKEYVWVSVPLIGFCIGGYLDRQETLRLTKFRDRSALFGRELKEGEKPSWPVTYLH